MRRSALVVALVCALSVAGVSVASAQDEGFTVGHADVGPVIGLGGINGAGLSFGGRFEKGFKAVGNGVLGFGVGVDYYNFSDRFTGTTDIGFTYLPIAATVSYHFRLDNKKIDPFVGAGLGFERVSLSGPGCVVFGSNVCQGLDSSGLYFVGHAGIRYFVQPKLALYADAGAGAGSLHVGIMFKVGAGK
jgi:hypothetical protein